jgi:hypothetical protein
MPHYKDLDNNLHFIDNAAFAHLLPEGCIEITDEEAEELRPKPIDPAYKILRATEYPPIADYLDGVVKGDQAQIDAYIAACLAVKEKYPKE